MSGDYNAGVRAAIEYHRRQRDRISREIEADSTALTGVRMGARAAGHDADADALAALLRPEPGPEPAFSFDRYINGQLMAEGVTIEKQPTLPMAMAAAAKIASRGPNGEVPVLVYACTAQTGPALAHPTRNGAILEAISLIADRRNALPPGPDFKLLNEMMGELDELRRREPAASTIPTCAAPAGTPMVASPNRGEGRTYEDGVRDAASVADRWSKEARKGGGERSRVEGNVIAAVKDHILTLLEGGVS
jgi:hypothetical protein